jgi:8-oxo-dGTP diphosphatase
MRHDDEAFLAHYRPEDFPRPSVAVDVVAFTVLDSLLQVLLVKRAEPPFRSRWALPGGFVRVGDGRKDRGESLDEAVARELQEETGLTTEEVYVEQLGAFGDPDRDPRMRVISIAYYALVRPDLVPRVRGGGDVSHAQWMDATADLRLAFDHKKILEAARTRIRERIQTTNIAASLVPRTFTIPELRNVYAIVTGATQDAGNFRRKFQALMNDGIVELAPGKRLTSSKPAAVYRFR